MQYAVRLRVCSCSYFGLLHVQLTSIGKFAQPFSSVVITTGVLCICWRSKIHSVISPAEKHHK